MIFIKTFYLSFILDQLKYVGFFLYSDNRNYQIHQERDLVLRINFSKILEKTPYEQVYVTKNKKCF